MSQLDLSIAFSQLFGLLLCFYLFLFYVLTLIHYYWYNLRLRISSANEVSESVSNINMDSTIKRILKY